MDFNLNTLFISVKVSSLTKFRSKFSSLLLPRSTWEEVTLIYLFLLGFKSLMMMSILPYPLYIALGDQIVMVVVLLN